MQRTRCGLYEDGGLRLSWWFGCAWPSPHRLVRSDLGGRAALVSLRAAILCRASRATCSAAPPLPSVPSDRLPLFFPSLHACGHGALRCVPPGAHRRCVSARAATASKLLHAGRKNGRRGKDVRVLRARGFAAGVLLPAAARLRAAADGSAADGLDGRRYQVAGATSSRLHWCRLLLPRRRASLWHSLLTLSSGTSAMHAGALRDGVATLLPAAGDSTGTRRYRLKTNASRITAYPLPNVARFGAFAP